MRMLNDMCIFFVHFRYKMYILFAYMKTFLYLCARLILYTE